MPIFRGGHLSVKTDPPDKSGRPDHPPARLRTLIRLSPLPFTVTGSRQFFTGTGSRQFFTGTGSRHDQALSSQFSLSAGSRQFFTGTGSQHDQALSSQFSLSAFAALSSQFSLSAFAALFSVLSLGVCHGWLQIRSSEILAGFWLDLALFCHGTTISSNQTKPDHNRPTNPITDQLNGWSTGSVFANPTQSVRIKNFPKTRTARPEPTPTYIIGSDQGNDDILNMDKRPWGFSIGDNIVLLLSTKNRLVCGYIANKQKDHDKGSPHDLCSNHFG
uniref:Uncharacterized protein n=1 Tax=Fagus sylvatica TaxID=28930 RepID=A0A2N9IGC1_FAGSY